MADASKPKKQDASSEDAAKDDSDSSMVDVPRGAPVQVIDNDGMLVEDKLQDILMAPDVQDKKVVLISVAGAFRKGSPRGMALTIRRGARRAPRPSFIV